MSLLNAERLSRKFDDQIILDDVSFAITRESRIGLVGKNGSGKTTLFDVIAGLEEVDQGVVNRAKSTRIDYAQQDLGAYLEQSLVEFVSSARADLLQMRQDLHDLQHQLELNPNDTAALERLGHLQQQYETDGGFSFDHEVKTILEGLGFEKDRHRDLLKNFSGGERNRAGLARVLAGSGNLLLLDEPTNHLDIESTRWLEEYLQGSSRAFIVVSHDRTFLQATVDKIWELRYGKLEFYTGGLARYLTERKERRRLHEHHYRHQQEEIKRIEEHVRRNMAGQKTKQAQSRLKYLQRIKRLPALRSDGSAGKINMATSGRSYAHVLSVSHLAMGYGSEPVVSEASFDLYRGDRVGLIGRNGTGKTTILKALVGELAPIGGAIQLGNKVDVAYFDQELGDLNLEQTVLDSLWERDPSAEVGRIRSFLARFGFSGDDPFKVIAALSGGERTKLSLARLLYHPANFIIFDEPTNHLDMDSREALEQALLEFDGSCLIVSHDRFFLDRVVNRIFHLDNGRLTTYDGNYSYFHQRSQPDPETPKPKKSKSTESWQTFKEQSRQRGRLKKALKQTQQEILDSEATLEGLEADIATNIPRDDWEQLQEASDRKKALEDHLIELYARLEELQQHDLD